MALPADSTLDVSLLTAAERAPDTASAIEADVLGLFDRFRAPLMRYICSFGLSARDAEDIVQDVFLLLFKHLHAGKPRTNLPGWIFRVAHNGALKQRLRRQRECDPPLDVADGAAVDPADGPEALFSDAQRQRRLLAVVSTLPERDRQCLHLRSEGLRYRDIARVLGVSLGTVANSLARSLERLQRADEG
jgi:RNA polymerase sigma-70 factor (ECF subfamily)